MTRGTFLARREHFPLVGSTNDIVAGWLADGTPEVCLASADEQTAGRGREGRAWQAPRGTNLLVSLGFRPAWLPAERVWQLAAIVSLAMARAGEEVARLSPGSIRLKWPNDLVVEPGGPTAPHPRKLAGVLGETAGLGSSDSRAVIGIGVNVDWARADFPSDLADGMTSLREAADDLGSNDPAESDRAVDAGVLRDAFIETLEPLVDDLRAGAFPGEAWRARQLTSGRQIDLVEHDGRRTRMLALDVDTSSGGLIVAAPDPGAPRTVLSGEVLHVRLPRVDPVAAAV